MKNKKRTIEQERIAKLVRMNKLRGGRPPVRHKNKKAYDRKRDRKINPDD